jgi:cytochrome c5
MLRPLLLALAATLIACGSDAPPGVSSAPAATSAPTAPETAAASSEDVRAVGQGLVSKHECNRCHDGTGFDAAPQNKSCVTCHLDIVEGRFKAPAAALAEWKPHVTSLRYAPSLSAAGSFVKPEWIERYLLEPHDVRPYLEPNMPRLSLDALDAKSIAVYFASRATPTAPPSLTGDIERGRGLFTTKTCATCHTFSGAGTPQPPALTAATTTKDRMLAPDLRFARDRLITARVPAYIRDPVSVKPDAAMPKLAMSEQEAADLAAFVMQAPLAVLAERPKPPRLPVLERAVGYDEVAEKVLHKICWHCHSQPDFARGDGGAGNTGGFGFKARMLDLSSFESLSGGYLDANGERRSLFSPGPGGEPVLLEVLLARQKEERGGHAEVRGMPLGMPSMSPEIIQLVETWVAQGHPR